MSAYSMGRRAGWPQTSSSGISVNDSLISAESGTFISGALDGGTNGCRWDRLRVALRLPATSSATFATYTSDTNRGTVAIESLTAGEWSMPVTIDGPFDGVTDSLVWSTAGRYLWLQVDLEGTEAANAELRWLDVTFPRNTSLRMLPAVYSTRAGGRDFNERVLSLFDAMRDEIKDEIRTLAAIIDPRRADAATKHDFLDWLGTWFDMEIYRSWPIARRRAIIHHAGELFRLRGTARGIELFVELALGRKIFIVEGFADRHWWFAGEGPLGCGVLFDTAIVGRAALDSSDVLGTKTINSVPAPMLDPFAIRANRMTVYVPCDREPSDDDLAMLQEVIDVQKPAHVAACIVLALPNLRLGVMARLGLDAVLGELKPPAVLAGASEPRLGVNMTLGGRS
ncbi:MAG: phage tail protein [Candidatus Cybelea sp.]